MMFDPACQWVIARLPLGVSAAGETVDRSAEGGDLALDELRAIRRHLVTCAHCRQHESSMRRAIEVLAVAALSPPLQTDLSSLWPAMEQRIAARVSMRPATIEIASAWPRPAWGRLGRMVRNWLSIDNDEYLRGSWLRDELRETLDAATHFGARIRLGSIAGSGMAAILATVWILVPAARRQEAAAQAVMASNQRVPAELAGPPVSMFAQTAEDSHTPIESDVASDGALAQAETARVVEATPSPAPDPAPVAKSPPAPTRFNYDLEHGTPMPRDSRDPKPVY
jgi:hypothetical protein